MASRNIPEIVEQLEQWREAYYNAEPLVDDAEYDALLDELHELDPNNPFFKHVGATPKASTKWKKVRHGAPMGSLNKVQTPAEFDAWEQDAIAKIRAAERAGDLDGPTRDFVISEKLDGISVSMHYEQGRLAEAITRGDGETGEDITRNVLLMKGVVKKARDFSGYVRGEIILTKSAHKKHVPDYKNPRNAASGIAKRESDPEPCKHLTVVCYQVISDKHNIERKSHEFRLLEALGFETPNWELLKAGDAREVQQVYDEYVAKRRDALDYEIDGLVIEFDDLAAMEHLGEHDGRPKGARAFKFPHEEQATRLREIVWQVGNSGRVTPVAYFDGVSLAGATVSQASLHNESNVRRLAASCPQGLLGKSDKILVSRRNDVIPYVERVIAASKRERLAVPNECPSCGTRLTKKGEYLVCANEKKCPAQRSGAVKRWVKKLDIKGWGDTLVEALCESGMVRGVADLYGLDADELGDLTLSGKKVGKSTATKVLKNLRAKMNLSIVDFVGSLGIDLWGRSMVKFIVQAGFDTLEKMEDASVAQIAAVPGVGDTKATAFVDGFKHRRKVIDELLAAGVKIKKPVTGGKLSGVSFCFTGVRDRAFETQIEEAGGTVKSGVGKGLTYLVAKSKSGSSAKLKKAKAQGVQILTLEEAKGFLK